ncbi:hypothetical protein [Streptomyces hirsutus]|uniref:hypothetical protein n=1 Tax=Streptomyces hirsutus TaxID=35620 RepID=UPI0036B72C01
MTSKPTLAQLRNIADRADRGPLTPAEVARLRAGIDRFDGRRATNRAVGWANRIRRLQRRLHALHAPMMRGGIQICGHCSGWNGSRCQGLVTEWPCPTLDALDATFPTKEAAA